MIQPMTGPPTLTRIVSRHHSALEARDGGVLHSDWAVEVARMERGRTQRWCQFDVPAYALLRRHACRHRWPQPREWNEKGGEQGDGRRRTRDGGRGTMKEEKRRSQERAVDVVALSDVVALFA
ncbi:hypothetical protein B0H11DRAFT_1916935 [Mycena galericulata]|nr:hypothetical protein B0H11DRAFT_1916935 [Mycena galericulata]